MSSVTRTGHRILYTAGRQCRAWAEPAMTRRRGRPACDLPGQARLRRLRLPPGTQSDQRADDLAALAGHLGLDRFALAGESGGGPFTLAAAHRLACRVSAVALIADGGPMSRAERSGQQPRIRFYGWLARNAPTLNTVPFTVMRWSLASPARRERSLRRAMAAAPDTASADMRTSRLGRSSLDRGE
jgi:pimeloyl-ACP methyl ester carboxylesterase